MNARRIFISAGELSGDLHGGKLVEALKASRPDLEIHSIGGDHMAAAGAELLFHIRETSFMGFAEVIKHLPAIRNIWKRTLAHIDTFRPEVLVLIDYPGFNLRLAKACHARGISAIYYISPQLWAWHQSRVKQVRKYIEEVCCILPFEEKWYRDRGVRAEFVGHPLLDQDLTEPDSGASGKMRPAKPYIGVFPGSRNQEVHRHLPVMISALARCRKSYPSLRADVAIADNLDLSQYQRDFPFDWIRWRRASNRTIQQQADILLMSSGTATLEAAIHATPTIVIYRLSNFSYQIGKQLVKVPYISIPNLIAGEGGLPELIQHDVNPENIAAEIQRLLSDPNTMQAMKTFMLGVRKKLGQAGASQRTAAKILNQLDRS